MMLKNKVAVIYAAAGAVGALFVSDPRRCC